MNLVSKPADNIRVSYRGMFSMVQKTFAKVEDALAWLNTAAKGKVVTIRFKMDGEEYRLVDFNGAKNRGTAIHSVSGDFVDVSPSQIEEGKFTAI